MIEALALGLAALALGLPLTALARLVAVRVGLVDRPDGRKRHVGEIALGGGLAVFATVLSVHVTAHAIGLLPHWPPALALVALAPAALALGMLDDRVDLAARLRLVIQCAIAAVLVYAFDVRLISLGNVLGYGWTGFEPLPSALFTVFCVVGVLNATNMMDGVDGLLATLAAVSLAAVALVTALAGDALTPRFCLIAIGAIGAFLAFNLGLFGARRRIFLGDSGSTMLGLGLAVLFVARSQGPDAALVPVAAGWLLGLPLLDITVVMARRLREGRSPFAAGRDHLHHRLQNLGLSPGRTLATMLVLQLGMVAVGLVAQYGTLPPWVFFYGFVVLSIGYFASPFGLVERPVEQLVAQAAPLDEGIALPLDTLRLRNATEGSPGPSGGPPERASERLPGPRREPPSGTPRPARPPKRHEREEVRTVDVE